ncbi:MAG: 30S ribosomal protein S6 [Deltaproteobacteria bacterium]|nr:30S ribosomal protein S6 [Deltaproteobacteria bacterium]
MLTEFQKKHQREYETIFILDPRVPHEMAERVVQRIQDVLGRHEGQLVRVEYWGKRKLSYRIKRTDWGFYYLVRFLGQGGLVAELERNFRMLDPIVRFQTILVKTDVDPSTYQIQSADLEFRLDLLAKEAAEPVAEPQADASLTTAPDVSPETPRVEAAKPKAEEPKAEEPKAEEPKAEEPKAEAKAEEPKVEAKAEEPKAKAEKPKAKAKAKAEEPKVEAKAKAEEPKVEAKAEEPKVEAKADEEQGGAS